MIAEHMLSNRDAGVLNLIFDPESQKPEEPLQTSEHVPDTPLSEEQQTEINYAESNAIQLAERGSLKEAEKELSRLIEICPSARPSLWNNRAQVRRLSDNVQGALDDIAQAIRLATPNRNIALTSENARVLSHAHTHRATIYMLIAKREILGILEGWSSEKLEEHASHDFGLAGRYGSDLARAMAVRTNPYSKMCGAIVQTALKKEMEPTVSR
jgi:tetratricopeptide (TPR) repeat protein